MNADFLLKDETDAIIGSAFAVLNEIGHGYHEKPYENGLVVEFRFRGITFSQQPRYPIMYRGVQVSEFVPDLIAFEKIIIDAKVIERITDQEIGQMLNYLRVTGLPVGLILNFKKPQTRIQKSRFIHPAFPSSPQFLIYLRPSASICGSFSSVSYHYLLTNNL